jgi:hypothetical protein
MSITNDIQPFAIGGGANVESQAAYLADPALGVGQQPGVASSALNNKVLRQGTFVASQLAQMIGNITNTNIVDNGVSAQLLAQMYAAFSFKDPVITTHTSGSSHTITYKFQVASANATSGATYTNNGVTYTVSSTISAGLELKATGNGAPTASGTLTKASGTGDATITFYAVRAPLYVKVQIVGGGAGGVGGGSAGTGGGNTTFDTLTANGGGAGSSGTAGTGGTTTVGSGWTAIAAFTGGGAGPGNAASSGGGIGGSSYFSGAGVGGALNAGGGNAVANSGAAGGGTGASVSLGSGAGGGAGGYIEALSFTPGTFAFSIGGAGSGGSAGGLNVGGTGAAGIAIVTEFYQ